MDYCQRVRFDERNGSSVLERAFRLLATIEQSPGALTLSELARQSGLPKPTVYRLVNQLLALGAVDQGESGYRLGTRLFEFGSAIGGYRRLRETAIPYLQDLYETTHQTVNLGVYDRGRVLYIEKLSPHAGSRVSTGVGRRKPMHCTALGKAILAFADAAVFEEVGREDTPRFTPRTAPSLAALAPELEQVRTARVAYDREEYERGTVCVAAPLLRPQGTAFGAVSVTGTVSRWDAAAFSAAVKVTALALNRALTRTGHDIAL